MKEFLDQIDHLSSALRDPEYLFLVLEPAQIYGIGFSVLVLAAAWVLKNEKLQVAALALIIVTALSTLPYMSARKTAQERLEHVYQVEAPGRVRAFAANTVSREEHQRLYFILAFLAAAALLVGPRRNRLGTGLTVASAVIGLYAVHFSLWMHYEDSLAFHPNLKKNEAPVREKIQKQSGDRGRASPATGSGGEPSAPDANRVPPPQAPKPSTRTVRPLD